MIFDEELARIEAELDLPYPDRALLVEELGSDLEAAYLALRAQGLAADDARDQALAELGLDRGALASLEAVHAPAVRRALARVSPPAREWLERVATGLPLAGVVVLLNTEVPLVHFLHQGGPANLLILGIGVLGLLLEIHRLFLWFVLRDHSAAALRHNTPTPLYLAAAAVAMGLLGTALDYYVVFHRHAEGALSAAELRIGLYEPLSCAIVGSGLAVLIVLFHAAAQVGLRALRVPNPTR